MTCQVCGAKGAEPHFGGNCCRACAAFFRRYVHSRKLSITCTCTRRRLAENSHPCRHCRMIKCLAIGMIKCKVQGMRERNDKKVVRPGSTTILSLLSCNIIPRTCSNISSTVANWVDLDKQRKMLFGDNIFKLNFTQITHLAKSDTSLLWNFSEIVFPSIVELDPSDKQAIISNFYPRWTMMESSIDYSVNYEFFSIFVGSDAYYEMMANFYGSSMSEEQRIDNKELVRIFGPYWDFHYAEIADPIYRKKCDKVEFMALFLLLLFDEAYTNISEDCARVCRSIRKVILRELKGYQTDNNCSEMRFIDVLDTLMLLEKAEQKFQEEVLICGLNNVHMSDDFKAIVQVKKL
ncbi:unnamed protein product [Caenorhabditis sp. 36 PRJEB53466]|nr:unnamed protein product [Caenorhabditis sp. 36 PRJEB53466]